MGIDVIKLTDDSEKPKGRIPVEDLAKLTFSIHTNENPQISMWLMSIALGAPLLPWWSYTPLVDEEIHHLRKKWEVTSPQSMFDCLFLNELLKSFRSDIYVVFSGGIRNEGWGKTDEILRAAYQRGQGCMYRLEGTFSKKMSINWVPFKHPQCLIRNPSFPVLWRLFLASQSDDMANCLTFFQLKNSKSLPKAINLLIRDQENRSQHFAEVVDWFGMYSSPLQDGCTAGMIAYAKTRESLSILDGFQNKFSQVMEVCQTSLAARPVPATAERILSRLVAL